MVIGPSNRARGDADRDAELPPILDRIRRRVHGWLIGAAVLVILLILTPVLPGMYPGAAFGGQRSYAIGLFLAFLVCLAAAGLCTRAYCRRLAGASAAGNLLCPGCGYDIEHLDDTGTCPECGRAYEHDAVRARWLDAERRLKRRA